MIVVESTKSVAESKREIKELESVPIQVGIHRLGDDDALDRCVGGLFILEIDGVEDGLSWRDINRTLRRGTWAVADDIIGIMEGGIRCAGGRARRSGAAD